MTRLPKNISASVRDRLAQQAREHGDDFQFVLTRYANERLLYRIATSAHADRFILKGAALFTLWLGQPHRATRDLDLLGFGEVGETHLHSVFVEMLGLTMPEDGVTFDIKALKVGPIREDQEYGGVRMTTVARIASAQVPVQVDIGFGDAVTPDAELVDFPVLLDFPPPRLRVYPRETVVAEKLDAMVQLGLVNSRMKDFFDVAMLADRFSFDGALLARAIRATFERRGTAFPGGVPVAFTSEFAEDATKRTQWAAFVRKAGAVGTADLPNTVERIAIFLSKPIEVAATGATWDGRWANGGPWSSQL